VFDDAKPIFMQLAEQLADEILRGVYSESDPVPSTNELAVFHRINPATAGKALNLLVDDGILVKRRGIGMFVADGAKTRLASVRQDAFARDFIRPLLAEADALGVDRQTVIRLIETEAESS